jgi:hypothetical protein
MQFFWLIEFFVTFSENANRYFHKKTHRRIPQTRIGAMNMDEHNAWMLGQGQASGL